MEIFQKFLYEIRMRHLASSSVSIYGGRLKQYARFLRKNDLDVVKVTPADIKAFERDLFDSGKKTQTIKNILSTVCVFYKWAKKSHLVERVPIASADLPKVNDRQRIKRLSDEDLRTFIAYIDNLQENARAAFWLLIGTGARVGEAAHLTATNVYLRGRSVYIDIKDAKWGSDRCIPVIDPDAARIVWNYRQTVSIDNRPLFRLSKRTIQWYATRFAQETGIDFRCHLLRHTFAARLTEKGVPLTTIQYLLGHKSLAMTAYYAQSALV